MIFHARLEYAALLVNRAVVVVKFKCLAQIALPHHARSDLCHRNARCLANKRHRSAGARVYLDHKKFVLPGRFAFLRNIGFAVALLVFIDGKLDIHKPHDAQI